MLFTAVAVFKQFVQVNTPVAAVYPRGEVAEREVEPTLLLNKVQSVELKYPFVPPLDCEMLIAPPPVKTSNAPQERGDEQVSEVVATIPSNAGVAEFEVQ